MVLFPVRGTFWKLFFPFITENEDIALELTRTVSQKSLIWGCGYSIKKQQQKNYVKIRATDKSGNHINVFSYIFR